MASKKKTQLASKKSKAQFDKAFGTIVPSKIKPVEEPEVDDDDLQGNEDFIAIPSLNKPSKPSEPEESKVIYIGHLPFGFEEFQVADFFKQFGEVNRSYVSRSPKTGRSRGYAFVEFSNPTVARIAADTMNDYLMFKKRLICRMVPMMAAQKIKWPAPIEATTERSQFDIQRAAADWYNDKNKSVSVDKFLDREATKKAKLKKLGINYEFDGYTSLVNKLKTTDKKETEKVDDDAKKRKRDEDQAKTWEQRKQVKQAADMTDKQKKQVEKKTALDAKKEKRLANRK